MGSEATLGSLSVPQFPRRCKSTCEGGVGTFRDKVRSKYVTMLQYSPFGEFFFRADTNIVGLGAKTVHQIWEAGSRPANRKNFEIRYANR